MDISTLVKATAAHVRITELTEGDVFKRMDERYANTVELKFGIVTGILSDGDTTIVTALELDDGYGRERITHKTFKSGTDVTIFPATPDEVAAFTRTFVEKCESDVKDAERTLETKQDQLHQAQSIQSRIESGALTAPNHQELEATLG